ncbi:hypothetical protein STEG23_007037 [Scotinomys teguina]
MSMKDRKHLDMVKWKDVLDNKWYGPDPVIATVTAKINSTDPEYGYSHAYCKKSPPEYPNPGLFLSAMVIGDIIFLTLMMSTSLYMVTLLYRHRKRVQHLHSPSLNCQPSPERKATHSILWLFIYMVYYIDRLLYVEPSLHLWDKAYLIMVDNVFDVFLKSVCQYFIEYFCINVYEED